MAAPITWQNIAAPSIGEASRALQVAQQGIGFGFEQLRSVLGDYDKNEQANWKQQDAAATQSVLDQIYRAGDVNAFNALQQSGALDQVVANNGARIDRAAVNQLRDGRLATLQGREKAGWEFANAQIDQREAPVVNQVKALLAQGKLDEAKPLIGTLSDRGQANMFTALDARDRELVLRNRDDLKFAWQGAEEFHKQNLRPGELEAQKLNNQGKGLSNTLTGLQVNEAREAAADREQLRRLENEIAGAAAAHSAGREDIGMQQGVLAKRLNLPTDARGWADFSNYTTDQLTQFNQAAKTSGVPVSNQLTSGDTMRADSFYRSLVDSGKFSPRVLRASEAAIRSAFNNPVGERALVGNDAFNAALARAQNQVGFDREDANNWYSPNSPNARRSYEELAKQVPDIVKNSSNGLNAKEDVEDVQRLLGEVGSVGIRRKDGTYVVPSANDMLRFIRQSEGGWFRDAKRAENIRKELEAWVNTPEAIDMAKKGMQSQVWRDKDRVRQLLLEGSNPPAKK